MSEYQYYEFRAIDHPLTDRQMRELRAISTRAAISRRSFSNSYTFGDLKMFKAAKSMTMSSSPHDPRDSALSLPHSTASSTSSESIAIS
jgi:uncharacterized protein YqjF (DUF2071 family)